MSSSTRRCLRPFHLRGASGPLFCVYYAPTVAAHPAGDILLVPPFGEEMNRCRAMVAMQARMFADIGIGTLIVDPYGTGDSGGDFSIGSLELWLDDLSRAARWLDESGNGCRTLWGIRLGAMLAAQLATRVANVRRLLFWQPVVDAKAFYTQFLRIRIAAEIEQKDGIKSTEELRRMAASGQPIEVSGYKIGPQLSRELDTLALPEPAALASLHISWCEVLAAADSSLPRANMKVMQSLRDAGVDIAFEQAIGPPFWQVHERAVAPELLTVTQRLVAGYGTSSESATRSVTAPPALPASGPDELDEYPVVFDCEEDELAAIVHRGKPGVRRGVVIVVAGGPQYRAGAHRQFVSLARKLAALGHPVLRFDLRGMGDSSGTYRGFEHSRADMKAAIDALLARETQVDEVVLFGECESASGILFYAYTDARVKGIVLVNPWVRTEEGRAQVIIKHYYASRLLSRDFWRKVGTGKFQPLAALRSFREILFKYLSGRRANRRSRALQQHQDISGLPLPQKTAAGLRLFGGCAMVLMSGHDYIAREFDEVVKSVPAWDGLLTRSGIVRHDIAGADHTFSRDVWKNAASDRVCEWLRSW